MHVVVRHNNNLFCDAESSYQMPIITSKEILCFCTVLYQQVYNYNAFKHVHMAYNSDPYADKRVLAWFFGLPKISRRNQASLRAS